MSDSNTHNNNGKHSGSSIMEENSEARAENLCDGTSNMSMDNEALKVMMQDKTNPNNIPEPPAMISERSTWLAKELFAIDGGQHQASYGAKPMIKAADQRHKDSLVPPFQPANSLSKRKTLRTQKDHLKDAARLLNACNTWTETSDKISVESDKEESEDEEELDTTPISEHKEMIANTYRPWISQKNEKVPLSTCGPPETDLLRAIHFYTSYYYTHVCPSPDIFESMDITSHIAIGMIIQELISDYAYKLGKEYQVCDPNELDGDVLEYLGNISADQDWQSESDDGSIVSSDRESSGLESSENSDGDAEEMNVDIDSNLDDDDLADGIEIESMDVDEKDQERDIEQNNDGYMADFDFSPSVLSLLSSGSRTMFNQDISSSDEDEDNGIVVRTLASSSTVHDQKDDTSEEDMSDEVPEDGDLHLSFTQVSETRLGSTFRFNHHDSSSEDEDRASSSYLVQSQVIQDDSDESSESSAESEEEEDEDEDEDLE
ncbi:hypothetical protein FBU30_007219 [Linnemannia zychae]|nr:hypothetical protein FBU30_007219 [Linnemannia zychae]